MNVDHSYTVKTSEIDELTFGLKAGVDLLNVDINNRLISKVGAGLYYTKMNVFLN